MAPKASRFRLKGPVAAKAPSVSQSEPSALLLAPDLSSQAVGALLCRYGFVDVKRADDNLQAMAGEPRPRLLLASILKDLLDGISTTADPDQALNHWEQFLREGINRVQLFEYLRGSPRILHLLCSVFGNSPNLAQTMIRDRSLVYWLGEEHVMTRRPSRRTLATDLAGILVNLTTEELRLEALRRFKRREMLRIGIRDLLRRADVEDTIRTLSELASVLVQAAYKVVEDNLRRQYGRPRHRDSKGRWVETGFAVMAMGKLGGGELNFSSDVDLIYVYASDEGETTGTGARPGVSSISNEEYFEYMARGLTQALADVTHEGYVFRVDLRLRAEGTVGRLARSIQDYERYYHTRGQVWERMALLKAWPIAGSAEVGKAFLRKVRSFVFGASRDSALDVARADILDQVKSIKTMINNKMAERKQEQRNVKLGIGGIREIEFVVQTVQILCGARLPTICDRSTLGALARFCRHGLLSTRERAALSQSYVFLRDVEHKLQMVHDLQTHALPQDDAELARCAVRLGYSEGDRAHALKRFLTDYRRHTALVNRVFRTLVETPERSPLLRCGLLAERRRRRSQDRR